MPIRPDTTARNVILTNGLGAFDGAALTIYSGTQPGSAGGTPGGSVLATGTAPTPAFGSASSGARPPTTWTLTVSNDGTAGFLRITSGSANIDIDIGKGSGSISLDETALTTGGTVTISGGTGLTLPDNDA